MLNRNDYTPLYVQLQRIIRQDIISGKYKEGDMIPSESQMMKIYGVTRTTIRKAISDLVNEGLLMQVQGKGNFVCLREVKHNIWNFSGFTDYVTKKNEIPVSKVLEKRIITQDEQQFMKLVRVRGVKNKLSTLWLTIDTSLVPLSVFPDIDQHDFSQQSLYSIMKQQYNTVPKNALLQIEPIMGDKNTKELLEYEEDIPLLQANGTVISEDEVEIEQVKVIYGPHMNFKIVTNI
ncbi:GntR family transcriptional regulator [Paenibacillus thiaminolyticus]|uniref:GntR family transcriptional regulator n=1 Tax=Paenibacillus thiaminolyticus TaxID=49283 RepID=A0AAP9J2D8_PANTH|nr:GntR family transcriptional regulator [Paenibacillus thiaminolyticus]MEC0066243.1 GntR family transcriptional regulator [Paenibacillus thiaminolyticus]MEC0102735.1 GntR family transcriptional regulator [Paenibacillus thiaminolyticus]QDM45547.1 GntR family transcriptional regulator [Paenibacillus thiaminolyticus]SUA50112.1 DNA-binding transcriptional regulator FrlR [Paenibacillus thiaminolyticus]